LWQSKIQEEQNYQALEEEEEKVSIKKHYFCRVTLLRELLAKAYER
jgi:hypothetical protein